jgi:signal transduction histidine kinase
MDDESLKSHPQGDVLLDARAWREEALRNLLTIVSAFAPLVMVVHTLLRPGPRSWVLVATVWVCGSLLVMLRFVRRVPFRLTAALAILALYLPGFVSPLQYGLSAGAAAGTTCAVVLAGIYFGRWPAALLLALAIGEYLAVGWLYTHGQLALPGLGRVNSREFRDWGRITLTFGLMAGFLAAAVHHLVDRLERHFEAGVRAANQLRRAENRWQRCAEELIALGRSDTIESGRLRDAFREICTAGASALEVERCSVWLLDEPGEVLRCLNLYQRSAGHHSSDLSFPAARYPAYFAALQEERTLAATDAAIDPRTRELAADYLFPLGITSMLDAPIRLGDRMVGVVCHEHVGLQQISWPPEARSFAGSMADFAARALAAADRTGKERNLRTAYQQLGQLHRRLESAKEEERRHIAHEMHDELGQSLTALKLKLGLLERRGGGDPARTADAMSLVDDVIDRVRKISVDLRPALLDEVGLVPALRGHLEPLARESGIDIRLETPGLDSSSRLPPETEIATYRLVQEAVTNVLRHAAARSVLVSITRRPAEGVEIVVRDDGRGFVPEETLGRAAAGGHLGLVGMRERARALGGVFEITSTTGAGTTVRVSLPATA